jgi:uncharacterized protein (TIGR01777 family)
MKTILIFGGTGFIGRRFIEQFKDEYKFIVVSRNPEQHIEKFSATVDLIKLNDDQAEKLIPYFDKSDVVINLAGENIGGGRWTKTFRQRVDHSRQKVDNLIIDLFEKANTKPGLIIQASAIGIYGSKIDDAEITENAPVDKEGFLAEVASKHEERLEVLKNKIRLVFIRTGIVLDKMEGALPEYELPFKFFAGGKLGSGKQWIPWIHIKDEIRAIHFVIENENISGPVNLTSPEPVRQAKFAKVLGKIIHRPAWIPAPAFGLRLILGKERADSLVLTGLKVIPKKLIGKGYKFHFDHIDDALEEIYR